MISIIVPVYNVRDYIVKCLESVASQTYRDPMECLIIDDCGQDDSILLAEEFVRGYNGRIEFRIIHHEKNRGLSAARNTGIRESKGEWLYFLDSDDWITHDCVELMMEQTKMNPGVDMVMGDIKTIGADYNWKFAEPGIYTDGFIEMSCSYKIYTMAWNKLLSKQFVLNNCLYFEEGLIHEDILWFIQCAHCLNMMISLKNKTYNYLIREGSLQTDKSYDKHYKNKALVRVKTIDYAFKNRLQDNLTLYRFLNENLYDFILEPIDKGKKYLSAGFYNELRNGPFWSLRFVNQHKENKRELLYALNRLVPKCMGLFYIQKVHDLIEWRGKSIQMNKRQH